MTVEARFDIVECFLWTVHQDATNLCIRLLDDGDLSAALQDLQRKRGRHHPRHSIGEAGDSIRGDRLSLRIGLADRLQSILPLLEISRLERRRRCCRWGGWRRLTSRLHSDGEPLALPRAGDVGSRL